MDPQDLTCRNTCPVRCHRKSWSLVHCSGFFNLVQLGLFKYLPDPTSISWQIDWDGGRVVIGCTAGVGGHRTTHQAL